MAQFVNSVCSKTLTVNSAAKAKYDLDITSEDAIGSVCVLDNLVQSLVKLSSTVVPESKKYNIDENTLRSDLTIFLNNQLKDLRISVVKNIKQKKPLIDNNNGNNNNKIDILEERVSVLENKILKLEQGYSL
jgi:hypothetical protein